MSEIKGQILGIILVLAIFGIVGAALKSTFKSMTDTVNETVSNITTETKNTTFSSFYAE